MYSCTQCTFTYSVGSYNMWTFTVYSHTWEKKDSTLGLNAEITINNLDFILSNKDLHQEILCDIVLGPKTCVIQIIIHQEWEFIAVLNTVEGVCHFLKRTF